MDKRDLILSTTSGALLSLAFPPLRLGFIAYGALVPFFSLFPHSKHKDALLCGFVTGLCFNAGTVYWICWPTLAGGLFSFFFLSLFFMLFALMLNLAIRSWGTKGFLFAPFLWTAIEYLRSFGQLAFPWTLLGNTQTEYTRLIQFASISGVYGISFWVVTINLCLYSLLRHATLKRGRVGERLFHVLVVILILLFIIPYIYGNRVIPKERLEGEVKVAVIQPSIPIDVKWAPEGVTVSFSTLEQMTIRACSYRPDLVIWPETATPCYLMRQGEYRMRLHNFCDSLNVPILTGSPDYDFQTGRFYNSAFLFMPGKREVQGYDKIHLVPGSERMPFSDTFPFLKKFAFRAGDFSAGKRFTVFQHPKGRFSTLICFESIFPELARQFALQGAQFLVNITNDAWFGRTSGPYQHAEIAVFRAIENRIAIARCANTGVSMFIDPYGRVSGATPIFTSRILVDTLPLRREETFFTRHGNLFSKVCVALSGIALVWVVVSGTRKIRELW
ncbi:MAG: apolipoprotein N-acyltransferase [Candidatus Latescibacterota bacterium]|nr:MAG: apolipoprotein N-acyltransferase [Candidatus Latescibacterota bacterium]RKY74163.1 MAG: apolipoprotein N-acyltransferase [Candidatus Latescibacterota bacterium]